MSGSADFGRNPYANEWADLDISLVQTNQANVALEEDGSYQITSGSPESTYGGIVARTFVASW